MFIPDKEVRQTQVALKLVNRILITYSRVNTDAQ